MKRAEKYKDAGARKARLLKTATEFFARDGYGKASLREICAKAGANLAAVKYYFKNKRGLYREVLFSSHRQMMQAEPLPMMTPGQHPEEALRQWVLFFLRTFICKHARHPQLALIMAHELIDPTPCLNELVKLFIRPVYERVLSIVTALATPDCPAELLKVLSHNTIGTCLHYEHAHPVLERLGYVRPGDPEGVAKLAESLATFILGGIRHCIEFHSRSSL